MHANTALAAGTVLADIGASRRQAEPSRYTIQRGQADHLDLRPADLRFINHGCSPNVHFDVERMVLVALRDLDVGDELRCFYPATEWSMAEAFDCACGAPDCLGRIGGAVAMPAAQLRRYCLSPFVAAQLQARGTLESAG